MESYQKDYTEFMDKYKSGVQVDGEEAGKTIAIMAQHFGAMNLILAGKENMFRTIAAKTINGLDENSGKPISAAKSEIIVAATKEAEEYRMAKAHLENINQYLFALKAVQKSLTQEYQHMGGV